MKKGYLVGPFNTPPFSNYRVSPLGVAEGTYSGKKCLIVDLSAPHNDNNHVSLNQLINKDDYSLTYVKHENIRKSFAGICIYEQRTDNGLSYDVVQRLKRTYIGQGYRLFIDNFYTSTTLLTALYANNTVACGTVRENRRGFTKTKVNCMPRNAPRGTIRRKCRTVVCETERH